MFSLFSASVVEIVYKDTRLALLKSPIKITMKGLEQVNKEWNNFRSQDKETLYNTFTDYITEGKMDVNMLFL